MLELSPDRKSLLLRAGAGWKAGCVRQVTVHAGPKSQAGFALLSSSPVIVEDLRTEKRFHGLPLLLEHGVISGVSVIIHGRGKPYGVLGAHTMRQRKFTSDDIHFLQSVANILAAAIERRALEEELAAKPLAFSVSPRLPLILQKFCLFIGSTRNVEGDGRLVNVKKS